MVDAIENLAGWHSTHLDRTGQGPHRQRAAVRAEDRRADRSIATGPRELLAAVQGPKGTTAPAASGSASGDCPARHQCVEVLAAVIHACTGSGARRLHAVTRMRLAWARQGSSLPRRGLGEPEHGLAGIVTLVGQQAVRGLEVGQSQLGILADNPLVTGVPAWPRRPPVLAAARPPTSRPPASPAARRPPTAAPPRRDCTTYHRATVR